MKTKLFLYLAVILALLGCSFFKNLDSSPSPVESNPQEAQTQEVQPKENQPIEDWLLGDPTLGLASLASYQQDLTISFQGTQDGTAYEWSNIYQRRFWKEAPASFLNLTTSETGVESTETLVGAVDQARYSRLGTGSNCQVTWGESVQGAELSLEPASLLPPIGQATEVGTETVNGITTRHYSVGAEDSGAKVAGEFWQAQEGDYLVRYRLTISGGEGEQRFNYELSQVNTLDEVLYPEGCSPVLIDFPVMDRAQNLRRLPQAVNYMVSVEADAVSQFYQEQLVAQGWEFLKAQDKDPQNLLLTFTNEAEKQAASILLKPEGEGVWVSVIVTPRESTPFEIPFQ